MSQEQKEEKERMPEHPFLPWAQSRRHRDIKPYPTRTTLAGRASV